MAPQTTSKFKAGLMTHMRKNSFTCTEEWIEACAAWVEENYPDVRPLTQKFLEEKVVEQWLIVNLEDMECRCLPPGLVQQKLVVLPHKYGLQVNTIQDIGESSFSQFTKIKKLENENSSVDLEALDRNEAAAAWAPKPRRCLFLTLTDGTQKISGMELEHISSLSLRNKIPPGTKVKIIGPVECRRGILHLTSKNIQVLGGSVDELAEKNSVDSILCRELGGVESLKELMKQPNHTVITFSSPATIPQRQLAITDGRGGGGHSTQSQITQPIQSSSLRGRNTAGTSTQRLNGGSTFNTQQQSTQEVIDLSDDFDDDDEIFMGIDGY